MVTKNNLFGGMQRSLRRMTMMGISVAVEKTIMKLEKMMFLVFVLASIFTKQSSKIS